jgi:hypothetical protein
MENWDWCAGRSADEIGGYIAYALGILKNAGLHCDGITTPGGFGKGALPEVSRGVFQAVNRCTAARFRIISAIYSIKGRTALLRAWNLHSV